MKSARKKPTAAKLRSWRVSIIRKRGQYLGTVEAPNEKGPKPLRWRNLIWETSNASGWSCSVWFAQGQKDAQDLTNRSCCAADGNISTCD
jgi:hypothetical protein